MLVRSRLYVLSFPPTGASIGPPSRRRCAGSSSGSRGGCRTTVRNPSSRASTVRGRPGRSRCRRSRSASSPRPWRCAGASGGAFDVTVGPLVDAWGFGSAGRARAAPDRALLSELRSRVGFDLLELDPEAATPAEATAGRRGRPVGHRQRVRRRRGRDAARRNRLPGPSGRDRRRPARRRQEREGRVLAGRHRTAGPRRPGGAADRALDECRRRHLRGLPQLLRPRRRPGVPHHRSAHRPAGHPLAQVGERHRRAVHAGRRPVDGATGAGTGRGLCAGGREGWAALFVTDDGSGRLVESGDAGVHGRGPVSGFEPAGAIMKRDGPVPADRRDDRRRHARHGGGAAVKYPCLRGSCGGPDVVDAEGGSLCCDACPRRAVKRTGVAVGS